MKKNAKKTTKKAPIAKGKSKRPEQLKLAGTHRIDAIEAIELAGEEYRSKLAERMDAQEEESKLQQRLTELLKKHDLKEYVYEAKDGKRYCAYVPNSEEPKAKVRRVKEKKPDLGDGERD